MDSILVPVLFHLRIATYTCAAGGTVLLYDIILTAEAETRLIWPSRFSLVKCLYLVNRYLPVPCLILGLYHLANIREALTTNFCKLVTLSQTIGQALSLVAATWLLVIRVIALYGGNKLVSIILYTVFITTHLVTIVVSGILLHQVWEDLGYLDVINICTSSTSPRLLGVVYITPIVCESVLVGMQIVHAYRHTRQLGTFGRPLTPLLRTLYADGFAYYIIVVALRLWSALLFTLADSSWWYMSTYIEFSLISTSVSRLVLHLRGVASASSENLQDEDGGEQGHSNSIPLSKMKPGGRRRCNRHVSSSFQNPAHTVYSHDYDQDHEQSREPYSSSTYLRAASRTSSRAGESLFGEVSHASRSGNARDTLTVPERVARRVGEDSEVHRGGGRGEYEVRSGEAGGSSGTNRGSGHWYTQVALSSPVDAQSPAAVDDRRETDTGAEPGERGSRVDIKIDAPVSSHGIG